MSTPSPSSRHLPTSVRVAPLTSIFISHSSKDNTFGYQLADNLRNMGYDAWYDSAPGRDAGGLLPGALWRQAHVLTTGVEGTRVIPLVGRSTHVDAVAGRI
jgi:hypothetical protein